MRSSLGVLMGTDIHSYVEQRLPRRGDAVMRKLEREAKIDGDYTAFDAAHRWEHVRLLEYVPDKDFTKPWRECYINHQPDIHPWYNERNYGLFGIIGGVRDRGGEHLDGHFRGYPPGFSGEEMFEHSITWYMCHELLDVDLRMPIDYGITRDVHAFVWMNKDLVAKYGRDNVRITFSWDS
jgi:hypothetical protein